MSDLGHQRRASAAAGVSARPPEAAVSAPHSICTRAVIWASGMTKCRAFPRRLREAGLPERSFLRATGHGPIRSPTSLPPAWDIPIARGYSGSSDLVVMPSGGRIFALFLLCAWPQGSKFRMRLYRVEFSHSLGHKQESRPPARRRASAVTGVPRQADPTADQRFKPEPQSLAVLRPDRRLRRSGP